MGGVHLPPSVEPVADVYLFVILFGSYALLFGAIVWLVSLSVSSRKSNLAGFRSQRSDAIGTGLPILGLLVILGFSAALPITQKEQRLRYEVETDLKQNKIGEGIGILLSHSQRDFPPQWTPPPWPEYGDGDKNPSLAAIVQALQARNDVPEWVHSMYREKAKLYLENNGPVRRSEENADHLRLRKYSEENAEFREQD
jgi:hypothetical protein